MQTDNNVKCWLFDRCNHIDCGKDYCARRFKLEHLYENALLSDKQRSPIRLFLDSDHADETVFVRLKNIERAAVDFVRSGKNLYMYSPTCGVGKTSWAVRLAQAYLNDPRVWAKSSIEESPVLFVSVPQYLLALKANISEKNEYATHIKNNIFDADLVIFDDIATKTTTPFESENLLSIIDQRIASGKSCVFTSNLSKAELQQSLGDRLTSRIFNYSECLQFKGKDKRAIAKED